MKAVSLRSVHTDEAHFPYPIHIYVHRILKQQAIKSSCSADVYVYVVVFVCNQTRLSFLRRTLQCYEKIVLVTNMRLRSFFSVEF